MKNKYNLNIQMFSEGGLTGEWYLDGSLIETIDYSNVDATNGITNVECSVDSANSKVVNVTVSYMTSELEISSKEYYYTYSSEIASCTCSYDGAFTFRVYATTKKRTSAKGTWLLNESLNYRVSTTGEDYSTTHDIDFKGPTDFGEPNTPDGLRFYVKTNNDNNGCVFALVYGNDRMDEYDFEYYYTSNSNYNVSNSNNYGGKSGNYIRKLYDNDGAYYVENYYLVSEENRTFTITGGSSVNNANLISWLESNAQFISEYEEPPYTVTINAENCTYTPSTAEIKEGETLTYTFTANSGCIISSIEATNCTYSVTNNQLTISSPTDNVVITVGTEESLDGIWLVNSSLTSPSEVLALNGQILFSDNFQNPNLPLYNNYGIQYRIMKAVGEENTYLKFIGSPYLIFTTYDYDGGGDSAYIAFYGSSGVINYYENSNYPSTYSSTQQNRTITLIGTGTNSANTDFGEWFKQNATKLRDLVEYTVTYNITNAHVQIRNGYNSTLYNSDNTYYLYYEADTGYEFPEKYSNYVYVEDTTSGYTITRNSSSEITITLNGSELTGNPTINVEAVKSHEAITPQTLTISNGVPGDTFSVTFENLPKGQITADTQISASKCLQEANISVLIAGTNVFTGLYKNLVNQTLYVNEEGQKVDIYISFPTDISQSWQGSSYTTASDLYDLSFTQEDGVTDGMLNFSISLGSISLEVEEITTPIPQLPVKFSTNFAIKNTGTIPITIGLNAIYSENMGLKEAFIIMNESGSDVSSLGENDTLNFVTNLLPNASEPVLITHKSQIVKQSMLNKEANVQIQIYAAQYKNNANNNFIGFTKEVTNSFSFVTPTFTTYKPIYKKNSEGIWESQEGYQMRKDDLGGFIKISEQGITYENTYNVTYLYPTNDVELIEGENTIKLGEKNLISVMFRIKDFANNDYYFPTDMTNYLTITNAQIVGDASSISDNETVAFQVYKSESDSPGDVTIQVACVSKSIYNIVTNLTGCTASSSNATSITQFGTTTLTFIPNDNASFDLTTLENNVTISGTSYTLSSDGDNLIVNLTNPTSNVSINVTTPNIYETITIPEIAFSLEGSNPVAIIGTLSTSVYITGGTGTYSVSSDNENVKPSISTVSSGTLLTLTFTSKAALQETNITVTSGKQTATTKFKPTISDAKYTTWYIDSKMTDATYGDGDIIFANTSFRDKTTNLETIAFATNSGGSPIMLSNEDVTNHFKLYSLSTSSYTPTTSASGGYAYEFNNSVESYYDGALEENRTLLIRDGDTTNETLINWLLRNAVLVNTSRIAFSTSGDGLYYGFYAENNTTWEEWVDSDYNTEGFTINDGKIYVDDTHYLENIESTYLITAGYEYTITKTSTTITDLTNTTWLLNETLNNSAFNSFDSDWDLEGYFNEINYFNEVSGSGEYIKYHLSSILVTEEYVLFKGIYSADKSYFYSDSSGNFSTSGQYIRATSDNYEHVGYYDKTSELGIALRTFLITGGTDVTSTGTFSPINWLQKNATLIMIKTYNVSYEFENDRWEDDVDMSNCPHIIKEGKSITFTINVPNMNAGITEVKLQKVTNATITPTSLYSSETSVTISNATGNVSFLVVVVSEPI